MKQSPALELDTVMFENQKPRPAAAQTIILMAFLGMFLSGYNNFTASIALLEIRPLWHLEPWSMGLILAATFIGMLIGSITMGWMADTFGRRTATIINMLLTAIFAILSGLASNALELILLRLLMGVGIGGGYPISSSYVADTATSRDRGSRMTLAFSGWGVGALACGLVGWLALAVFPVDMGWRLMLASGAIPAILAAGMWVLSHPHESGAWLHSRDQEPLPFPALFEKSYRKRTLAALVPWFLMDWSVYGIGLLIPTMLLQPQAGGDGVVVWSTCLLSIFTLLGLGIAFHLIDRLGRRRLQVIGFMGMTVLYVVLAFINIGVNKYLLFILFAGLQLFTNAGPNTVTWIVAAELFPTRLRARGQGIAVAFSRMGAAGGAFFLPVISAWGGWPAAFLFVAAASAMAAGLTHLYLPETARCELAH